MSDEQREGTGAHMVATRYTVFCSTCGEIGETTSAIRHVMIKQDHMWPHPDPEAKEKRKWSDKDREAFRARALKGHATKKEKNKKE